MRGRLLLAVLAGSIPRTPGPRPFVRSGAAKKQQEGVETRESVRRDADLRIGRGVKARHAQSSLSRGREGRVHAIER